MWAMSNGGRECRRKRASYLMKLKKFAFISLTLQNEHRTS